MNRVVILAVLFILGWSWVCVRAVPVTPREKDSGSSICSESGGKTGTATGESGSEYIREVLIGTALLLGVVGLSVLLRRGEEVQKPSRWG